MFYKSTLSIGYYDINYDICYDYDYVNTNAVATVIVLLHVFTTIYDTLGPGGRPEQAEGVEQKGERSEVPSRRVLSYLT